MMIVSSFLLISYLSIINGYDSEMFQKLQSTMNSNTATLSEMLKELLRRIPKEPIVVQPREVASEVAYGKRTKQSSDYYFYASAAVDGNLDTYSHTGLNTAPYWEVDLGKEYKIERIEIFNRKGCCGERLHDLDITIGSAHNQMYLCTHYKGPGRNGEHLVFKCNDNTKYARYVRLTVKGREYLHVGEVKVYAFND
ncbi:fucolectin-6-like [Mytilus edulis]|uniref:fucolectin-6-like n=1 Tax=Mytilus edulis TaxID=6550 RepID=UPI0039EF7E9C